jgi:hypothetical protein
MPGRQVPPLACAQQRKGIAGFDVLDEPVVMEGGDPGTDGPEKASDVRRDGGGRGVIESEGHLDLLSVGDGIRLAQRLGLCPKSLPKSHKRGNLEAPSEARYANAQGGSPAFLMPSTKIP